MAGRILYPGAKSQYKSFFGRYKTLIIALLVILLLAIFYIMVQYSAYWLVKNDDFKHVKYAIVLDGQGGNMERSDFALKLLAEKKVDTIIVSGSKRFKRLNSAELARDEMLAQGDFDSKRILTVYHNENSTFYEAKTIIPYLKARKTKEVLLITSSMASARANQIFTKLGGDKIKFLSTNMDYSDFIKPETWTTSRMGKKIWLIESLKKVYTYWELLGVDEVKPIKGKTYLLNHENNLENNNVLLPINASVIDSLNKADSLAKINALNKIDSLAKIDSIIKKDSLAKADSILLKKDSTTLAKIDSVTTKKDSSAKKASSNSLDSAKTNSKK